MYDLQIKRLRPEDTTKYYADNDICKGLVVRVTPAGTKSFVLRIKKNGKRKELTIGAYGEVKLADARKRGLELRGQISLGEDVWDTKPKPESLAPATVEDLSDVYIQQLEARGARKAPDIRRILSKDVLPVLGNKVANEITPYDIGAVLRPIIKRGSMAQAKKARSYMHSMYNVGMALEYDPMAETNGYRFGITTNPVTPVPAPVKGAVACDRFLTEAEVKRIWNEIPNHMSFNSYMVWRLLICTGCRVEEIAYAKWSQVEDNILFLPTTKNGKPHEVVLCKTAISLIKEVREVNGHTEVMFPQANAIRTPMVASSLAHAIRKMCKRTDISHFTARDARRTFKTLNLKHGADKAHLDLYQNHAIIDVSSKHYIRYDYLKEKQGVANAWNEVLTDILA